MTDGMTDGNLFAHDPPSPRHASANVSDLPWHLKSTRGWCPQVSWRCLMRKCQTCGLGLPRIIPLKMSWIQSFTRHFQNENPGETPGGFHRFYDDPGCNPQISQVATPNSGTTRSPRQLVPWGWKSVNLHNLTVDSWCCYTLASTCNLHQKTGYSIKVQSHRFFKQ